MSRPKLALRRIALMSLSGTSAAHHNPRLFDEISEGRWNFRFRHAGKPLSPVLGFHRR
jgi:hypothetical protein